MMCAALQERCRVIEVPVTYAQRMGGESKHSDTFSRQAKLAIKMFRTICRKRFLERGKKVGITVYVKVLSKFLEDENIFL